jgi:hypothetical protein
MAAETSHVAGQRGVQKVKQWLESTTHVALPWSVYDHPAMTTLPRLDGAKKVYDLSGYFLGANRRPIFIESKHHFTEGGQGVAYPEYLANAYSTTSKSLLDGVDTGREYMWVTWHPFLQSRWSKLTATEEIHVALRRYPEVLNGSSIEEELVRKVASRLWLVVLSKRQEELSLTREELRKTQQVIDREGC